EEWLEIADLERLGEVLIVVECLRATRLHVEHLQVEALNARQPFPVRPGNTLRDEALIGRVHCEGDKAIDERRLAFHPWTDRLDRHVTAVYHRVARQSPQRGRIACHLDICVLENIFVAIQSLRLLVEAS